MSQVIRKLQDGDRIVRVGTKKYKYDDIVSKASNEVDSFMDLEKYKQEDREAFSNAYADLLEGMKDGSVYVDDAGRVVDTKGRYKNAKNPNFDAYGHAVRFIKKHIPSLTAYTDPKKDADKVKTFAEHFSKEHFGGRSLKDLTQSDFDVFLDYDKADDAGNRDNVERVKIWGNSAKSYADYLTSLGKTDEAARYLKIYEKANDGVFDHSDLAAALQAGTNMEGWQALFGKRTAGEPEVKTALQIAQEERAKEIAARQEADALEGIENDRAADAAEDAEKAYQEAKKRHMASDENEWLKLGREFEAKYPGGRELGYIYGEDLDDDAFDKYNDYFINNPNAKAKFFSEYIPQVLQNEFNGVVEHTDFFTGKKAKNNDLLRKLLSYGQRAKFFQTTSDGTLQLFRNKGDGTVYTYDTNTGALSQLAAWRLQSIRDWYSKQYDAKRKPLMQQGGILNETTNSDAYYDSNAFDLYLNNYAKNKQASLKKGAEEGGYENAKDYETYTSVPEGSAYPLAKKWNPYQTAQIGAVIADGLSIASAIIPALGNTFGAVSGALGTLFQFGADFQDGFQGKDAWNLVAGLAGDAVSVVPFVGNAFKISRAGSFLQKFRRILPVIMQAPAALTAAANIPGAAETLRKVTDSEEDLTVKDWQALGHFLTNMAGVSMGIRSAVNANRMLKARVSSTGTPEKWSIKGSKGEEIELTKDQYDHVLSLKKEDDINNYLKELNLKDTEGNFLKAKTNKSLLKGTRVEGKHQKAIEGYDFSDVSDAELDKMGNWKVDVRQYKEIRRNLGQDPKGEAVSDFDRLRNKKTTNAETPKQETKPKTEPKAEETPKTEEAPKTETPKQENKPKNKSNNKKKKKHDKGGIIEHLRILKAQGGANSADFDPTYNNEKVMQRASNYLNTAGKIINNWYDATNLDKWDSYYNMDKIRKDAVSYLKTKKGDDLAKTLNHLNSFNDANMWEKKRLNGVNYQDFNNAFKETGLNQFFGEDVSRFQYMGPSTWNRKSYIDELNKKGYIQVQDGELRLVNGQWKLFGNIPGQKLSDIKFNTPTIQQTIGNKPTIPADPSIIHGTGGGDGSGDGNITYKPTFKNIMPEVMAGLRLIHTLQGNKAVAKKQKESINPVLTIAPENHTVIDDNYALGAAYDRKAAAQRSNASKAITPSAELARAANMEGFNQSVQTQLQGDLLRNQEIKSGKEISRQVIMQNVKDSIANANNNKIRLNAADSAKKQIDAGLLAANNKSVETYMQEGEYRLRKKLQEDAAIDKAENLGNLKNYLYDQSAEGKQLALLQEQLDTWQRTPGNELKSPTNWSNYEEYKNLLKKLNNAYTEGYYQISRGAKPVFAKEGTKLAIAKMKTALEGDKQFLKDVQESTKNHIHMIDNLSSVTKQLILTAMT